MSFPPIDYETRLDESGSKHMALYLAIRDAIADGLLPADERLPSTRWLADHFGLSRGSVSLAYEMLAAEGFVRASVGQGTFVAGSLSDAGGGGNKEARPHVACAPAIALSAWGDRIVMEDAARGEKTEDPDTAAAAAIDFAPQGLGAAYFPWAEWRSVVSCAWKRRTGKPDEPVPGAAGSEELRRAIAVRLRRERGIRCSPDDVVVTGGSMQAIALLAQLLLEDGRAAVAENPGYAGIHNAIRSTGATLVPGEVDDIGIVPRGWEAHALFVTPSRQFPTGAVLSYERRLALLDWASRRGAWIVEDDYDSDFRWGGRPIEPLKALDRSGRVIYVGTFSRSMRTEVRIGYAVVPPALRAPLIAAKKLYEPYPTGVAEQRALADWMAQGGFDRHMRRATRRLGKLEGVMRSEMQRKLGALFEVFPADAGLYLYAEWKQNAVQYEQLRKACDSLGVGWKDGAAYDAGRGGAATDGSRDAAKPPSALFGFAHLDEERIRQGIGTIRQAADRLELE